MSEQLKNQLIYEIAEDLIKKFDSEISEEILNIVNKYLYNYDVIEKSTSVMVIDSKTEKILKLYIGTKKLEGKSEKTLKQYYREVKLLLAFLNCSIDQVTTNGIKIYLMTMKTERDLKNTTVENMRSYLSAVFTWVANEKFMDNNPCAAIAPIKIKKEIKKSFSDEELEIIKDFCKKNIKHLAIINFLYSTGCRVSELCSTNIKNVDFKNKQVIVLGKGNKERIVYLNDEAYETLILYLKTREDKNEALFLSNRKTRITVRGVEWILKNIEEKTGIEDVHPHRFRRTLATNLLDRGMAIQDVSKLLGHANVNVTQVYYYHTDKKVENEYRKFIQES